MTNSGKVHRLYPGKITDARGSFTELWRASRGPLIRQVNLSVSRPGVIRGMHYHRNQTDLWTIIDGRAEVHLVNLRTLLHEIHTLRAGDQLLIEPGIAHGFLVAGRSPLVLLYGVTTEYDGSDEFGYRWDDQHNGRWLLESDPIVSERDRNAPYLREVLQDLYRARPEG